MWLNFRLTINGIFSLEPLTLDPEQEEQCYRFSEIDGVTVYHNRGVGNDFDTKTRSVFPKKPLARGEGLGRGLFLLLLTAFAPACAPNEPPPPAKVTQNLVLLTDVDKWVGGTIIKYIDSLENENYRVIISGYTGEKADQLIARLPWLLQPGVDLFLYDDNLAGTAGYDSLVNYLERNGLETKVRAISPSR